MLWSAQAELALRCQGLESTRGTTFTANLSSRKTKKRRTVIG
jgi:hypothetical protein